MQPAEFEREALAGLRVPAFWKRWGRALPPAVLSPHGQGVLRALGWCHENREPSDTPIGAPELMTALKKERNTSKHVRALAAQICQASGPALSVESALAGEILQRAALQALMERILAQQQSGKVDLDSLARTLNTYQDTSHSLQLFDPDIILAEDEGLKALPTPWACINENIEEGLFPKELGMVLAEPKVGKTKMLLNLAAAAIENAWNVLYITAADIGYAGICRRMVALWLDLPSKEIRGNAPALERVRVDWEKRGIQFQVADYAARPCLISDIEHDIEAARAANRGDLAVFIDRLEEAVPAERTGDLRREVTANYQYARMFAQRYAVPIWVDSQASLNESDQGWVSLTRGAEARIGKAKVVDLALGVGVSPEDDQTLRVILAGRRDIGKRQHELRTDPGSGRVW